MAGKSDRIYRINSQEKLLPKAFINWMDNRMPRYIIYESGKRKGTCTGCGKTSEFTKLKYNQSVTCPACRKRAVAKTEKRIDGKKTSRKFVYIQKINNGIMARFIERIYTFRATGEIDKECYESLRAAVEKGRRQYWYEKRFWYGERHYNRWGENNVKWNVRTENSPVVRIAGYGGWSYRYEDIGDPPVYTKNQKGIMADSLLRFLPGQGKELIDQINDRNRYRATISGFLDVYEKFHQYPCLEALYKCGMKKVVEDFIYNPKLKLKKKEHQPHKILGISKELFRGLREEKEVTQDYLIKCIGVHSVTGNVPLILEIAQKMESREIELFFEQIHMPIKKTLRYLAKLECGEKITYMDYIRMASDAGSDMTSEFVLFPRDLEEAHDAMIEVRDETKRRRQREEAKKMDSDIEKVYKKIQKRFSYEDETYMMRPAKSNVEIVMEGQKQHICVGYGGYAKKMIAGESYILFLRKKSEPDKPYYTVEVSPDYDIIQRHGKYNKEGDEKQEIDAFLEKFRKEVGHVKVGYAS